MSEKVACRRCGEPMPEGEEMFQYHGYSGPCPKPMLPRADTPAPVPPAGLDHGAAYREAYGKGGYLALPETHPDLAKAYDRQARAQVAAACDAVRGEYEGRIKRLEVELDRLRTRDLISRAEAP